MGSLGPSELYRLFPTRLLAALEPTLSIPSFSKGNGNFPKFGIPLQGVYRDNGKENGNYYLGFRGSQN